MNVRDIVRSSIEVKESFLASDEAMAAIDAAISLIVKSLKDGHRVFFCGNGGSAADAQHLAAELSGRFYYDRAPLPAEALHVNTSYLTAVANDYAYEQVFARYIAGAGQAGDVLVGLSTSGRSANVALALEAARGKGLATVALTGADGGTLAPRADVVIRVPSADTPRVQECHILAGHAICQEVEAQLFPRP